MSNDDKDSKVSVDTGLKVALKSIGIEDVPEEVSSDEYEELSSKVSRGVRLRMEAKAKEQNKVMMWKSRVNLVKQARQLMIQKSFSEAAVSYEKYLRVVEIIYELPAGGLTPDLFNKSTRSKELTVITSVYWDLVRIYDTSPAYGDRMQRAANKLAEFLPYSTILPQVGKKAQAFQRSCKNPQVIRSLLRRVKVKGGPCFIATSVYGNPLHPQVIALRQLRDKYLYPYPVGRKFILLYYRYSPAFAIWLDKNPCFKPPIRGIIQALTSWKKYGKNNL